MWMARVYTSPAEALFHHHKNGLRIINLCVVMIPELFGILTEDHLLLSKNTNCIFLSENKTNCNKLLINKNTVFYHVKYCLLAKIHLSKKSACSRLQMKQYIFLNFCNIIQNHSIGRATWLKITLFAVNWVLIIL